MVVVKNVLMHWCHRFGTQVVRSRGKHQKVKYWTHDGIKETNSQTTNARDMKQQLQLTTQSYTVKTITKHLTTNEPAVYTTCTLDDYLTDWIIPAPAPIILNRRRRKLSYPEAYHLSKQSIIEEILESLWNHNRMKLARTNPSPQTT